MMSNLRIGDRCIVTFSYTGLDEGRIVEVTDYMTSDAWGGYFWDEECDVVIRSLDGVLHSMNPFTGVKQDTVRPYPSKFLRKLPEIDINEEMYDEVPA